MEATKVKEIYWLEDGERIAELIFKIMDGKRSFLHCDFRGVREGDYTLADWRFLKKVAEEIIRLEEEDKEVEDVEEEMKKLDKKIKKKWEKMGGEL